jgi:acetyltransferase-like isoleucine patch superfamily enzyme
MSRTKAKRAIRTAALRLLIRAFLSSRDEMTRQALFLRIRRADDHFDDATRELMKRLYDVEIGRYTHGAFKIDGSIAPGTRIGSFCSVAPGVRLGGSNHPLDWVSTHGFQYLSNRGFIPEDNAELRRRLNEPVVIEDDVWLGTNALVLPGMTVHRGAVIGAGAVVSRDVPPYAIAAGVPARVVRKRLPDEQVEALLAIDWPSWDDDTIRRRISDFYDPQAFIDRFSGAD